jgi:hypothetical protein
LTTLLVTKDETDPLGDAFARNGDGFNHMSQSVEEAYRFTAHYPSEDALYRAWKQWVKSTNKDSEGKDIASPSRENFNTDFKDDFPFLYALEYDGKLFVYQDGI